MKLSCVEEGVRHIKCLRWLIAFTAKGGYERAKMCHVESHAEKFPLTRCIQQCQGQINIFLRDLYTEKKKKNRSQAIQSNLIFPLSLHRRLSSTKFVCLIFDLFPQYSSFFFDWHSNLNMTAHTQEISIESSWEHKFPYGVTPCR
jgi:hypothetical protein